MAKILIVDDDYAFAEFAKMFVESMGHRTLICMRGERALSLALQEKPDMILLDLGLPDISGVETIQRLQADSETKKIPILLCSITHSRSQVQQALSAGAKGFLRKPLQREALERSIHEALGG